MSAVAFASGGSALKTLLLVLSVTTMFAGGAWGRAWLEASRVKHRGLDTFESFYWRLQKNDLEAAGALVLPGSEADLALVAKLEDGVSSSIGRVRGFALDLRQEAGLDPDGRSAIRLHGHATVNVDPAGRLSAFGVPEVHEVEAHLIEADGGWRVVAFRDVRVDSAFGSEARR